MADRLPDWYPDPTERFEYRYFDGQRWTDHVSRSGAAMSDPYEDLQRSTPSTSSRPTPTPWSPTVDLDRCRDVLTDLIYTTNTPGNSADEIERCVFSWGSACGGLIDPQALLKRFEMEKFGETSEWPWQWLLANARAASEAGDHELVAFCAFWVHQWKNIMQPKFGPYERQYWVISNVPSAVLTEIRSYATTSLAQIPRDRVLFGNQTGQITAGFMTDNLSAMLQ